MEMENDLLVAVAAAQTAFLTDLKKVMQVPSVKGAAADHAPFGIEPKKALETVLELADSYGFKTGIVSDAVGYAQLGPDNNDYIAAVGHLDVVPAGSGWDYPPFDLTEDQGVLYGRGVLDNKGPIFSCLYALKVLKETGVPLQKTIRILFGTDEESGSADLPLYLATEAPPSFAFTPDGKYPVVYGERGIVNLELVTELPPELMAAIKIHGDQARDHVPDELTLTYQETSYSVTGKRAPTNAPELGENAITLLAQQLRNSDLPTALRDYFSWLADSFHQQHFGEGINLALADQDSGKLILTPYELLVTPTGFHLGIAIRYPVSNTEAEVVAGFQQILPPNSHLEIVRRIPGTMFPKENPNVQKLSTVYEKMTGLDGSPVTTTGATYARSMPNTVAFGPSFPGQKGIAHNKNEYMTVADLMKNFEIYTLALYALAND